MEEKIKDVQAKLLNLKERPTNFSIVVPITEIDNFGNEQIKEQRVTINKGSTLSLNIIEGEFDDTVFDINEFTPMIEVVIQNEKGAVIQVEHTKMITPPLNMTPIWKEILPMDIVNPSDEIAIQIINQFGNQKQILAEKRFTLEAIGQEFEDPLKDLVLQRRIEDILEISDWDDVAAAEAER